LIPSDISVVICTRSEARWAMCADALRSIQRQTAPPRDLVLVVDHNPTLLASAREQFPDVKVVENTERQGLSGARNSGVHASSGAVVAVLDDDAEAEPDWLERIAARYDAPSVLGVGGLILPVWLAPKPDWFPAEFNWVVGCSWRGTPTSLAPVRNLIGANMSFRRDVFDTSGGFRSGIGRIDLVPLGCEETEFCIRAGQRFPDGTFMYDPAIKVQHKVAPERNSWQYFRSRCYAEGMSKALVSYFVGSKSGLSAELNHALWTLPTGVLMGIGDSLRHLKPGGIQRGGAIIAGLFITTAGFLAGKRSLAGSLPADTTVTPQASVPSARSQ
jgi:GT2 family glycosyltransferase